MRRTVLALGLAGAALMALPAAALAHPGHMEPSGFMHGFEHPLGGLDHLLAMVAVGLWAAQSGGRALLALPAAFVGAMILGPWLASRVCRCQRSSLAFSAPCWR
jgi:urease accessory protein